MNFDGLDDIHLNAIKVFVKEQSVSISLLQRRMKIGYSLALSLVARLEFLGFVSRPNSNGLRVLTLGYSDNLASKGDFLVFRKLIYGDCMQDIHIDWDGPFTLDQALQLQSDIDYGLYQYYGDHPVYGQNTLLYLGKAVDQPLGRRLSQHNWQLWTPSPVQIYVGRLCVNDSIDVAEARKLLSLAEVILLYSHSPGFNTSNLNSIGHKGEDVRIMNWGMRKSLFPEVSISRWEGGVAIGHSRPKKMSHLSYGG